jgi:ribonuclease HI
MDGGTGAAAVLFINGRRQDTVRYYLGPDSEHTVYEVEVVEILLSIALILWWGTMSTMAIALDNQAAIRATQLRASHPGAYLLNALDITLQQNFKPTDPPASRLLLRWIPGHKDVEGNDAADKESKKTAHSNTRCTSSLLNFRVPTTLLGPLPLSRRAAKAIPNGSERATTSGFRWDEPSPHGATRARS